jgi:hypothetical protein
MLEAPGSSALLALPPMPKRENRTRPGVQRRSMSEPMHRRRRVRQRSSRLDAPVAKNAAVDAGLFGAHTAMRETG